MGSSSKIRSMCQADTGDRHYDELQLTNAAIMWVPCPTVGLLESQITKASDPE